MKSLILLVMLTPCVALAAFDFGSLLDPAGPLAVVLLLAIGYVMGKTEWVKAGSLIELVLNLVLKIFKKDGEI